MSKQADQETQLSTGVAICKSRPIELSIVCYSFCTAIDKELIHLFLGETTYIQKNF